MRFLESLWLGIFLLGLLLLGVFGTWAETTPFWYGAGIIAVSGVGALLSRQSPTAERISWGSIAVMAAFALYFGWRGFTSEVRWLARQDLVFGGTALVTYGLIAVRFTTPRARLAVLAVLFLLIAGNVGVGLYQYFGDPRWTVFRLFGLRRAAEVSAGGFFESGNHFAGFLTLAGLPMLGIAVLGQGLRKTVRSLAGVGFFLASIGVIFSTSRGGTAGFFCGMGFLILLSVLLKKKKFASHSSGQPQRTGPWLLALAFSFVLLLGGAGFVVKRFFGSGNLLGLNGRGALWDAALEQWLTAPIIGTGARSYEYMERSFRTLETSWMTWAGEVDAVFAHNDYLQCLADYGLIGLSLALLVTAVHLVSSLRSAVRQLPRNTLPDSGLPIAITAGAAAALAGIMLQALVEFNLHIGINAVLVGLLLGLLATPGFPLLPTTKAANSASTKPAGPRLLSIPRLVPASLIAAVSLLLAESAWRLAPADRVWRLGRKQLNTATTLPDLIATSGTFQKATTLDPDNFQAWYLRGLVTLQIASLTAEKYAAPFYEAALTQLEQSLILNPYNPYAASQAGNVAGYLGRLDLAESHFANALRRGQNIQSVLELYGDYLLRRKEHYKAIGYLLMALHLSGDPDVRGNLDRKMHYCLKQLKQQGIAPPPEAFLKPTSR